MARTTRPNVNTYRLGTLWIRPEVGAELEALCTAHGRTMSDVLREAITEYLATHPKP